ncbi:molybdopterin guanine dinucleotide synthesis [Kangsaoukella pontilimi]|uniref:molybdopterin guanine dinucleotide synthesis n=1 Tax=Kangsaoukella pontilimi TaxID=2691042 RepID=UPI0029CA092D|nr:molybdopterin guanine dinucleotide synthesis [Kangsaoukella pontilimi]
MAWNWVTDLIDRETEAGRRLLLGFDFPFAYPEGFARAVTGSDDPLSMWNFLAETLVDTPEGNDRFALAARLNARFAGIGPFWFNGTARDHPGLPRRKHDRTPDHGMSERRRCESHAKGTFTCWQMGGAGAVGGQVMTGCAFLSRLRARFPDRVAVWPFEPLSAPVALVEVWPSLLAGEVRAAEDPIKDRAQVDLLSRAFAAMPPDRLSRMLDIHAPVEGWILGLGHERELAEALCPA